MAYKSQLLATEKYNKKSYDDIRLRVYKGKKEVIEKYSKMMNTSINNYINKAIDCQLAIDGYKPEQEQQAGDAAAAGDQEGKTGEKQQKNIA